MNADLEPIASHDPIRRETQPGPARPSRHLLIVEDDPFIRRLNARMLTQAGFRVNTAGDGLTAWMMLQEGDYDLLVTDHGLPEMRGLELIARLRGGGSRLPVILASGSIGPEEEERRRTLGVTALLHKPYSVVQLLDAVEGILGMPPRNRPSPPRSLSSPGTAMIHSWSRGGLNE